MEGQVRAAFQQVLRRRSASTKEAVVNSLIYHLDSLDWSGSAGGRHITGHIVFPSSDRRVEMERTLTLREAKEMGETQELLWKHRPDRKTNRFDTRADLERAAVAWMEANVSPKCPDWLLQHHSSNGPWRPIAARGYFIARLPELMALAALYTKLSDKGREGPYVSNLWKVWSKLVKPRTRKQELHLRQAFLVRNDCMDGNIPRAWAEREIGRHLRLAKAVRGDLDHTDEQRAVVVPL